MNVLSIKIYDETLRDGEQQVDVNFTTADKRHLFNMIKHVGVNGISVFPIIDAKEANYVKDLITNGHVDVITSLTMSGKRYIDQAIQLGIKRIMLFYSVSDRLLFLGDPISKTEQYKNKTIDDGIPSHIIDNIRQKATKIIIDNVRYAKELGLRVDFGGVDSPRADFNYLVDCIKGCSPYIEHFILCDSVGVLTPEQSYRWVKDLRTHVPNVEFGLHYHNDKGLAVENVIQSLLAGASMVSGTFRGIGERSGNVALEQVLNGLRVRYGIIAKDINYNAMDTLIERLKHMGLTPAEPYSKASQYHESGIHVDCLMRDPLSFSIFPHNNIYIVFGSMSGISNYKYLFEIQLKKPQSIEVYIKMRDTIKTMAVKRNRYYTSEEVIQLWKEGTFNQSPKL